MRVCAHLVPQLYPTLCHPMDCSPPSSSVHSISQGGNSGVNCHRGKAARRHRDLSDEIESGSPALKADSLPLSHWRSPKLFK